MPKETTSRSAAPAPTSEGDARAGVVEGAEGVGSAGGAGSVGGAGGVEMKPRAGGRSSRPEALDAEERLREAFERAIAGAKWAGRSARRVVFGRPRASRAMRFWRAALGSVMTAAGLFTLLALGLLALAGSEPAWWTATGVAPQDAPRLAEEVERGVGNALHRGRDAATVWKVAITQDEANAWVVDRLPRWLANQGVRNAEKLPEVRVAFEEGRILLGFRPRGQERTATLTVTPYIADGGLWTPATGLMVGRLPLPAGLLRTRALEYVPEQYRSDDGAIQAAATLAGEIPAPSTVELADGRTVRVIEISVEPGRLLLTCETTRE